MPERDIDFVQLSHFNFYDLFVMMGWFPYISLPELVFLTLVWAFCAKARFCVRGMISCTLKGVEINLDANVIFWILGVPKIGLRIYESKVWPTIPRFELRQAIQRIYGLPDAHRIGNPSTHSSTIINRVLHHMLCFIFLPRGGHRDEVYYYEAFLIDLILIGRQIHLGYLMMMHMITYCKSTIRVFPYGRFLSLVFKKVDIDMNKEMDFILPSIYDMYNDQFMKRMNFERAPDDSWVRKAEEKKSPMGTGTTTRISTRTMTSTPWS